MVGLDHGGGSPAEDESAGVIARNSRYGIVLFGIYLLLYAGFVLACALRPDWMAVRPWADVNLAIWYGFGLIGTALVMALIYSWLCRAREGS